MDVEAVPDPRDARAVEDKQTANEPNELLDQLGNDGLNDRQEAESLTDSCMKQEISSKGGEVTKDFVIKTWFQSPEDIKVLTKEQIQDIAAF